MKTLKTGIILLIAALSALGLVGCQSITPQELANVEAACKDHKGLRELNAYPLLDHLNVECLDGAIKGIKSTAN